MTRAVSASHAAARRLGGAPLPGLVLAGLVLAAACSLGPRPDPSRFYVLTSLAETEAAPADDPLSDLYLGVGPVTLPGYLSRGPIVTRVSPNRIVLSELDRWAEPLEAEFARVLAENLSVLLGTERVRAHPWYASERVDLRVAVRVARFERDSAGAAELIARWTVRDEEGRELADRRTRLREPADAPATAAAVAAQSRAVADLAREIAAAIRRARPGAG